MTVRLMFAAVLAALLTVPLMAQVQKKEMAGVRNYSRVDATVGCGGQVDPTAMKALKGEGYVSVINLRLPTEEGANVDAGRAAAQAAGLKYIHLPFNAAQPDTKVVDSFLAAVADKSNQPVFIHCGSRQPGRRHVDDQARAAGQVGDRPCGDRGRGHRPEQPAAQAVRHGLYRRPSLRLVNSQLPFPTPNVTIRLGSWRLGVGS